MLSRLIASNVYDEAQSLVQSERTACLQVAASNPQATKVAKGTVEFIDYIINTWMSVELWKSWSRTLWARSRGC